MYNVFIDRRDFQLLKLLCHCWRKAKRGITLVGLLSVEIITLSLTQWYVTVTNGTPLPLAHIHLELPE